jgi:hypothetical protein
MDFFVLIHFVAVFECLLVLIDLWVVQHVDETRSGGGSSDCRASQKACDDQMVHRDVCGFVHVESVLLTCWRASLFCTSELQDNAMV